MIVFLKEHDPTPYHQAILYACQHNLAYDPQIEGSRAVYMFDVLTEAARGDPSILEFYHENIFQALIDFDDEVDRYDAQPVYGLVRFFAEEGSERARQLLYSKFDENPALADFVFAETIVLLDEIDGFIYAANRLGEHLLTQGEEFPVGSHCYTIDHDFLEYALSLCIGDEATKMEIERLRTTNSYIAAYLNVAERISRSRRKKSRPKPQDYADVKQLIIQTDSDSISAIRMWGKNASVEELTQAAHDLLKESDSKRLFLYLNIFRYAVYPLEPETLFSLTQNDNRRTRAMTLTILENVTHPSVRAFALEMIEKSLNIGRMSGLLLNNFQEGDWNLIQELTLRPLDPDDYHSLGMSVRHLAKKYPTPGAVGSLLNVYERGPCSFCREHVVEILHQLDAVPDWMYEECQYDSNLDLRERIENRFSKEDDLG